ncbi:Predicted oxidoreductase, contains short-chain dehydrogenase (SDR) and DUF2520 domains [Mucilaginibacter mallensis]|uniref:Predicted oxidoreductase, contains short-chain dehydrogenase (SDR) and DUF2520 domains n=2 Tax=Mucilaginibacter mallensis TaxID=652787 RepID=A0A1H1X2V6_MUCMA|nr:Predicted oxidoreductase, contains short-chain dehydrogenase (SDR) and DUF2520 domains [Mucilaginibacter mallensis]
MFVSSQIFAKTMRITIIGSGNIATHLGAAFKNAGHRIVQVYSRSAHNSALLAYHIGAEAINNIDSINPAVDIFIIAVSDDAIPGIASELAKYDKLMAHTSGVTNLQALLNYTDKAGVFYPLQTFSKTREIDFLTVPLCIEAADETIHATLKELAQSISNNVYDIDSVQRKVLHLAAVFACNFPNYLYGVAQDLLKQNNIQFDLLRPLILETAQKVQEHFPADVQTGPAIREDFKTMDTHLEMLAGEPGLEQVYKILSQGIIKKGKSKYGA